MNAIDILIKRYPMLAGCQGDIREATGTLIDCFEAGNRLYICGNGGSAADALHITSELVKPFVCKRKLDESFAARVEGAALLDNLHGALPVFALAGNAAFETAFANDCDPEYVFAQQVYAYAREGDCVLGISTSGASANVLRALQAAKGRGALALGLTGSDGDKMRELCDVCICVPETGCFQVQELHLPVYHAICLALEEHFWNGG